MTKMFGIGVRVAIFVAAHPTVGLAGDYGSAGVVDPQVDRQIAAAGVWCPTLEAWIPENLFNQMDCNETGMVARPAVASERVTNSDGGLFGLGPHQPVGPRLNDNDNDDPSQVARAPDKDDTPIPLSSPPPPNTGPVVSEPMDPIGEPKPRDKPKRKGNKSKRKRKDKMVKGNKSNLLGEPSRSHHHKN